MSKLTWIFTIMFLLAGKAAAEEDYLDSVAQVRVTNYSYSIDHPWQRGSSGRSHGSAVIIGDEKLLTNAHVVDSSSRVEVRRAGSDTWHRASVVHVSEASDLAMLEVAGEEFFEDSKPADLTKEVDFGSDVLVVGFPIGGSSVSVTSGVLSRSEVTDYAYSYMYQESYQIDAAVNSGNSGGAVFSKGKLIGISFQGIDEADNIGYAIPVSVIQQFLKDTADGSVDGVPQWPFISLPISNPSLAGYLRVEKETGVYIAETVGDKGSQCVSVGDVVLAVEGDTLSNSGVVDSRKHGVISMDQIASRAQVGDVFALEVIRGGEKQSVDCELKYNWKNVWGAPGITYNYRPKWLEVGGLILVDMAEEVFLYVDENEILLDKEADGFRFNLQQGPADDPVGGVLVSNVLDHDVNDGYELNYSLLKSVNGEKVGSVDAVKRIVSANTKPWLVLEFYDGSLAVFEQAQLESVTEDLSSEYGF